MKNTHPIHQGKHAYNRPHNKTEISEEEEDRGWKGQYGQHPVSQEEHHFRPSLKDPDVNPNLPNE